MRLFQLAKKALSLEKDEGSRLLYRYRILILMSGPIYAVWMQINKHFFIPFYNANATTANHDDLVITKTLEHLLDYGSMFFLGLTCLIIGLSLVLKMIERNLYISFQAMVYIITIHYFTIVNETDVHKLFVMGTFILVFSVSYMMATARSGAIYMAFIVLCSIGLVTTNNPTNPKAFFVLGQITIGLFAFVTILDRRRLELKDRERIKELSEQKAKLQQSEENIRLAVDATGVATWLYDLKTGEVTGSSQYFKNIALPEDTGKISNDRIMNEFILPEDRHILEDSFARVISTQKGEVLDYRVRRADGEIRWFQSRGYIYTDEKGKITKLLGTTTDITEKKSVEFKERHARERLELALEAGHMGSWDLNVKTGLINWSEVGKDIYGFDRKEEPDLKAFYGRIHRDDQKRVIADFQTRIGGGSGNWINEFRIYIPQKGVRWIMESGKIFYNKDKEATRAIGITRDITESKLLDEEIHRKASMLREAQKLARLGSWEIDLDTKKVTCSDEFFKIYGLPPNSEVFSDVRNLILPEDLEKVDDATNKMFSGDPFDIQFRIKRDEKTIHVRSVGKPGNMSRRYTGFVHDITEHIKMVEELRHQKEFIEKIAAASPSIFYVWDLDTRQYSYVSDAMTRLLGYEKQQVYEGGVDFIISRTHPDDVKILNDQQASELDALSKMPIEEQEKFIHKSQYRIMDAAGNYRWLQSFGVIFERHPSGRPKSVLGNALDISESREMAHKIEKQNEIYGLTLRAANLAHWEWNPTTNHLEFDRHWFQQIDVLGDDTRIETWMAALHPDDVAIVQEKIQAHLEGKTDVYECVMRLKSKNGDYKHVLAKGKIVEHNQDGLPTRFSGVHVDLTEMMNLRSKIEEQQVKLFQQAKLSALGEMAAGIAHEIFNPVAGIKMRAQVVQRSLDKGKVPSDLPHILKEVISDVDRCHEIISGLKNLSRDPAKLSKDFFNPIDAVNKTISLCRTRMTGNGIKLMVEHKPEDKISCYGNSTMIFNVVVNLINNAVDAVLGVSDLNRKYINIHLYESNGMAHLAIEDGGEGISAEARDKIFHPFFTTKDVGKGTGLGLSISKSIIEQHGGSLVLASGVGEPTRFLITLPVAVPQKAAV